MAAYTIVSATGNVGVGFRTWNTGGWDASLWTDVGDNATLRVGRYVFAQAGTRNVTGIAANLRKSLYIFGQTRAFVIIRNPATTKVGRYIFGQARAFVITRNPAGTFKGYKLAASTGVRTVTGIAANLKRVTPLIANTGVRTVTGIAATTKVGRYISAAKGTFAVTGIAATTRRGYPLVASTGIRTVTGIAANLVARRRIVAATGARTITGQGANLGRGWTLYGDAYVFNSLYANENLTQSGFTGGFGEIDETVASDLDFAWGANNTSSILEVGLTNPTGIPRESLSNTLTFRYAKVNNGSVDGSGSAVTVRAYIINNAVIIATDALLTATGTWQERSFTFSTNGLINQDNLAVRFTSDASGGTGTTRRGIAISWLRVDTTINNYQITTREAFFNRKYVVTASAGALAITRNGANLARTRRMVADNGSRIVTGIAAILKRGRYILASRGIYVFAGGVSFAYKGYRVIASTGNLTLTRRDANLIRLARIAGDNGARIINGNAATLKKGFYINNQGGNFIVSGKNSGSRRGYVVIAATGLLSVSGKVAITKKGFHILASRGIFSLIGRIALLYRKLIASAGSVTINGFAANLNSARYVLAANAAYLGSYKDATLKRVYRLSASSGVLRVRYSFTYLRYAGYGFLRPDGNVTQTNFTGGFAEIDEIAAVDSDFAWSANNAAAVLQVTLSNPAFLPINGAVVVRFRIARTNNGVVDGAGNTVTVTPSFYQGAVLLATGAARTATGTWTEYSFSFDASLVTDWTNVQLRFDNSASGGTGTTRRGAAISWARVELPLVASPDSFGVYGESVSFEFGNTPYIIASKGSIQIFGQDANFLRYLVLIANSRAFTVSTGQAVLARSRRFTASAGSFAVTGVANNFRRGIVMPAATGSASVTGNAATTARSRILTASAGARSVTGVAAILKKGFKIFAANGSYSIVNGNALFQRGIRLVASNLSLLISGQAATTRKGFKLVSGTGVYAIFGNTAIFLKTYVFVASKGTFIIIGNVAQSQGQYALTGSSGSVFILDGQAAFLRSYVATAISRAFSVFGPVQSLAHGRKLLTLANSYIVIGKNVNFQKGYTVIADADIFSIASSDTKWIRTYIFGTVKSQVSVTGNTSILSAGYSFPVVRVAVLVTGVDARLRYKRRRQKMLLIL